MIIYDKNFNFIGTSLNLLSLLGYEDISSFKTFHNDVADLFVKKTGFIHKFDNFSWINYVLNGGSPNKKVLISLRNGNKIEADLDIDEVLSIDDENDKMYVVRLHNIIQASAYYEDEKDDSDNVDDKSESIFGFQDIAIEHNKTDEKEEVNVFEFQKDLNTQQDNDIIFDNSNDIKIGLKTEDDDYYHQQDLVSELKAEADELSSILPIASILPTESIKETKEALDDLQSVNSQNISTLDIAHISDILGLDVDLTKELLNDVKDYLLDSVMQVRIYIENDNKELINIELKKMISITNILDIDTLTESLENAVFTNINIEKEEMLDVVEQYIKKIF